MAAASGNGPPAGDPAPRQGRLGSFSKLVFGMGDHSVNLALSSLSIFFLFFLTEVAGLRPALAGLAIFVARCFDAVSDPVIGRFSDTRSWSRGRRRPFFLMGMVPFGVAFGLLWQTPFAPDRQAAMFAYYLVVYMTLSLATTTLSVPYLALIPEMARDYHERTSLNAYRAAAAVTGTMFAVGMRALADAWGGDGAAYAAAGSMFGVWLLVPWLPVHAVSFERPTSATPPTVSLVEGSLSIIRHPSFQRLSALFVAGRIALDLVAAALAYYTAAWLGRPGDVVPFMLILLFSSMACLPIWLRIGQRADKHRMFMAGAGFWAVLLVVLYFIPPDFPRGWLLAAVGVAGFGYCAADLMPWSMIGEVIDEDELATGHRREGIYNGFFTVLRKIGGASGVAVMGVALDAAGYAAGEPPGDAARQTIRLSTTLVPAAFLAIAIAIAARYPLTRSAHADIRSRLDARTSSP